MTTGKLIVLITGASSGIGRTVTEYLASQGALVYAGARKDKDIADLDTLEHVRGIRLDVTKTIDIERTVQHIETETGHLDCLVNNVA